AANSGSLVADMVDSVDWIGRGILHPEVMITHVGVLDSAADATLGLDTDVETAFTLSAGLQYSF
ncbi:MAG: hypothetical protein IKJ89_03610, partial [Kiritimatiellae bacterium]|nr:hypothetical protein [Kiritimatiellia bacterium]